jgi:hypothetical protein
MVDRLKPGSTTALAPGTCPIERALGFVYLWRAVRVSDQAGFGRKAVLTSIL